MLATGDVARGAETKSGKEMWMHRPLALHQSSVLRQDGELAERSAVNGELFERALSLSQAIGRHELRKVVADNSFGRSFEKASVGFVNLYVPALIIDNEQAFLSG